MTYVLKSDNKLLKVFREALPLDTESENRIIRCDILRLRECILCHYEINCFSKNRVESEEIKNLDFHAFSEQADPYFLLDSFRRSIRAGEVVCVDVKDIEEFVRRKDYAQWSANKGVPLPRCLTANIKPWEMPSFTTVRDVQSIDWNNLSPSVLAAFGANSFAQASKRADAKVKKSMIYKSPLMRKFLGDCAVAEAKEAPKAEDTIREYIEPQFPN